MTALTGAQKIGAAFARALSEERAALVTYLTVGYPDRAATRELVPALVRGGADVIELGVPFSDPIADGPVIQRAAYQALAQGTTPRGCLDVAAELRAAGVAVPFLFMGYYNPILSYGPGPYARACREAGVDGLIVPDLPLEEATELGGACRDEGLALVALVAPGTPEERLGHIAARAQGFLYLVSRPGITGARADLPEGLREYVARARRATQLPLALGFGIGAPAQARRAAELADGVVVGSAIVDRASEGVGAVEAYVGEMRQACAEVTSAA
jgi:tryptophan synthase alpha chain